MHRRRLEGNDSARRVGHRPDEVQLLLLQVRGNSFGSEVEGGDVIPNIMH